MKRLFALLLISFATMSCEMVEEQLNGLLGEKDSIIFAKGTELTANVSSEQSVLDYEFESTFNWEATTTEEWLEVSPTQGKAGKGLKIQVTVKKNTRKQSRTGYINLILTNSEGYRITINQAGANDEGNNDTIVNIPNNQIWYTSTNDKIVEPYRGEENDYADALTTFGANIISNTYENGQGIITFDNDVTKIGYCAFWGYDYFSDEETSSMQLSSIIIPNSVTAIEEEAFSECYNLTDVTIGGGVTIIGDLAFTCCEGLANVTIPDSVTTIGEDAFLGCISLTSITIPDSVVMVKRGAFADCSSLQEFKGQFASEDGRCLIIDGILISFAPAGLTEYTTPDSATEIGEYAFSCYGSNLVSIVISNSVTTIRFKAFWACCESFTSITIPDSVTTIESCAFEEIESLTNVYCKATTPPTAIFDEEGGIWEAFGWNAPDRKIYVPIESVDTYRNADGWNKYAEDIVGYDF